MNYEKMSDLEIDQAVTRAKLDLYGWEMLDSGKMFYSGLHFRSVINYCNSPTCYMQIAIESKISINFDEDSCEVSARHPLSDFTDRVPYDIYMDCCHSKIGRAVCIVYLKMIEAKNAN